LLEQHGDPITIHHSEAFVPVADPEAEHIPIVRDGGLVGNRDQSENGIQGGVHSRFLKWFRKRV
jgi:hypothetical protein